MAQIDDLVVVLPGITGSTLQKGGKEAWALSGKALWAHLRSLGGAVQSLEVPVHDPRTDDASENVSAQDLIGGFHGVFGLGRIDGYGAIREVLSTEFALCDTDGSNWAPNYLEFAYDWRLSCRHNARILGDRISERLATSRAAQGNDAAQVILLAHSMGGLVSRYWLEVLGGWRMCRALISFGTPYRGSLDAVGYVANGYKKAFGDLTDVLRSCPSVYELMPIYECLAVDGNHQRVAETVNLPDTFNEDYLEAGLEFHREIEDAVAANRRTVDYLGDGGYTVFPVHGVNQPTNQSATLVGTRVTLSRDRPPLYGPELDGGDGTVPRVSATPIELSKELREVFFAEQHGSIQNNPYVLEDLVERLKQMQAADKLADVRGAFDSNVEQARTKLGLEGDALFLEDEPAVFTVSIHGDVATVGEASVELEPVADGALPAHPIPTTLDVSGGSAQLDLGELQPGRYRLRVGSTKRGPRAPHTVIDVFEVAGML